MSMDADLWSARIFAAKRHHVIQSANHQWEYRNIDDFEGEDDIRPEFACPYCYEELEIAALCVHLEEHTFESKGVTCPVCALKVSKDIVGHITLHHGHLFKIQRRQRFRRPSGSTFSLFSKEYRETHLQSLLGGSGFTNNSNTFTSLNSASDTLLDSLDSSKQGHCSSETKAIPTLNHKPSLEGNLSMEERERKLKDEMRRTTFVQQLVVSAMLGEII